MASNSLELNPVDLYGDSATERVSHFDFPDYLQIRVHTCLENLDQEINKSTVHWCDVV